MKKLQSLFVAILCLALLTACGGKKLDQATSDRYIGKAEEVVASLNKGDYASVHALFNDQMKKGLSEEQMAELEPVIEGSGEFEKTDKASVEEKDGNFVVVLVSAYSKEKRIYTITFDANDQITGLYIK